MAWAWKGGVLLLLLAVLAALGLRARAQGRVMVSGVVVDAQGPVAGATVRQQATQNVTTSGPDGRFGLSLTEGMTVTITAWQEGYLVGWAHVAPPAEGITITIQRHYTTDNPYYPWFSSHDLDDPISCIHCMVAYPEWVEDAHSQSAVNPRFFAHYNGTTLEGTQVVAPGYKLDFPGTAGNCATCHAPAAAVRGLRTFAAADMNELQGVEEEGVFCEFCHKVGDIYLNPATGLPYDNAPGVLSMRLYRPESGDAEQLFFGPFDDVTRRVSYSAWQKSSGFCAPCHQFSFWGTPIYESYREWLESPYAEEGIECQDCHMVPSGIEYFVYPEKGGLIRGAGLISSHLMAIDEELLQNSLVMEVRAEQAWDLLQVTVAITNTETGHHVPTDFPGRHMILTVSVRDAQGAPLALWEGPTVPQWGGEEAGLPGKAFAKVLRDAATGESPVMHYWKQVLIESDNRIAAFACDRSHYAFRLPPDAGLVQVEAELRYRRNLQDIMDAQGWDSPDITMEWESLDFQARPWHLVFLPAASR